MTSLWGEPPEHRRDGDNGTQDDNPGSGRTLTECPPLFGFTMCSSMPHTLWNHVFRWWYSIMPGTAPITCG